MVERIARRHVDNLLGLHCGLHADMVRDERLLVFGVVGKELLLDTLGEHVLTAQMWPVPIVGMEAGSDDREFYWGLAHT